MRCLAFLTFLLVISAACANPVQPEQSQPSPVGEYPVPVPPVEFISSQQVSGQPQQGVGAPVVNVQSPQQSAPQVVEAPQQGVEQPQHHVQQHHAPAPFANYYAPAGMIVVGEQGANKPGSVRNFEQYGQPESASLPPNYKPFGSFGLYIGGNPADGYYTNYYKALSNSVDKQSSVVDQGVKPQVGGSTAALSPFLRQASSSPYVGSAGDYYSFAYSPAELSSAARAVGVEPVHSIPPPSGAVHSPVPPMSPVQAGAQVYGAPASFESNYAADSFATKKVGSVYAQKEMTKEVVQPVVSQQAAKGPAYQSRVYVYPSVVSSAPVVPYSAQGVQSAVVGQQQHVVAYPVPVGSQIIGSQPGVEGAFNPYGIHAFTRYAVKPTVVNADPSYYYGVGQSVPTSGYKQQQVQYSSYVPNVVSSQPQPQPQGASYYPFSFYGYPMNQLHYSQGSVVPSMHSGEQSHHAPIQPVQPEGIISEKFEKDDKPVVNVSQQKRA